MDNPEKRATLGARHAPRIIKTSKKNSKQQCNINKRIPNGQTKTDNLKKLSTYGTQNEEKQSKNTNNM